MRINPATVHEAIDTVKEFCEGELKDFFDEYSDTDLELTANIYAAIGTVKTLIENQEFIVHKNEKEEEEKPSATAHAKIHAGDVANQKAAVLEIGCKLCEALGEWTDDLDCVKEILVNLIESLVSTFGIRTEVITWLIKNMNS